MAAAAAAQPAVEEFGAPVADHTDLTELLSKKRPLWMYVVAGVAATLLLVWLVVPSGDDEETPSVQLDAKPNQASHVAAKRPGPEPAVPRSGSELPKGPEPTPSVVAVADAEPEEPPELYGPEEPEEIIEIPVEEPPPVEAAPAPPVAQPAKTSKSSKRKNKRRDKGHASSAAPAPAAKPRTSAPTAEPSAAELLTQATRALSKGQSSTAYNLAAKSNRKKKSTAAKKVMVKAACKMKSESKARSAFHSLPVGSRSGLRPYCRDRGVRLGI